MKGDTRRLADARKARRLLDRRASSPEDAREIDRRLDKIVAVLGTDLPTLMRSLLPSASTQWRIHRTVCKVTG